LIMEDLANGNVAEQLLLNEDDHHQIVTRFLHTFTEYQESDGFPVMEQGANGDNDVMADDPMVAALGAIGDNDVMADDPMVAEQGANGDHDVTADDDEEEEVDRGLLALFCEAKSLVQVTEYQKKKRHAGVSDSNIWKIMKVASFKEGLQDVLQQKDPSAHRKMTNAAEKDEYYCICLFCFDDPERALTTCLVKPSFKKGFVDGTSNLGKHIKINHAEVNWDKVGRDANFTYRRADVVCPSTTDPSTAARQPQQSDSVSELHTTIVATPPTQVQVKGSVLYVS
jgi:hypothetical protein